MLTRAGEQQLLTPQEKERKTRDHTHMDQNYNMKPMPHVVPPNVAGWNFLGTAVLGSGNPIMGPVLWTGTFTQLLVVSSIKGLGAADNARLQFGNASAIDTAQNCSGRVNENLGVSGVYNGGTSLEGVRLWHTDQASYSYMVMFITNELSYVKMVTGHGQQASSSKANAPDATLISGIWDNTTDTIQQLQVQTFTTNASSVQGSNMGAGSYLVVWGSNNN